MAKQYEGLIISINGQPIPDKVNFSECKIEYMDMYEGSYRDTQNGALIRNFVARKRKINIVIPYTNISVLRPFLQMIDKERLKIVYQEKITNTNYTGYFYHNDIVIDPYIIYDEQEILCKPFSINFIEE